MRYILKISFREEILCMLDKLIESCNKCGDSTFDVKRAAQQLIMELEKYTEKH